MTACPFTVAAFFVLRTPSLPFAFQEAWASGAPGGCDRETLEAAHRRLRGQLQEAVDRPEIREALWVASPDLEASLDAWRQGALPAERARRIDQSLICYLTRMSSRPTPFGLFAGGTVGAWGAHNRLVVAPWNASLRRTRLDMDYLDALVVALDQRPEVRPTQTYHPNSSLHGSTGRWHYAESRVQSGRGREHHLVALEPTRHLDTVLRAAASGACLADLSALLVRTEAIEPDEADGFLRELLDAQILVSGLAPPLTGGEPLPTLVAHLGSQAGTLALGAVLADLQSGLSRLDAAGIGNPPEQYRTLTRKLEAFAVPIEPKHLFQVDQYGSKQDVCLGPKVRKALEEAVVLLNRLTPRRPPPPLDRFKAAFRERYEARWVPLLEALDPEAGLGFGSALPPGLAGAPLLDGLAFPAQEPEAERPFSDRDEWLLKRLQGLKGAQAWALEDLEVEALANPAAPPLPDSFFSMVSLAATSVEAMDEGRFQVLMGHFHGPSGARLFGRFCHGDPELEAQVRAHLAAEEAMRPEAVFAEVVHQPDGRIGNILARPNLRQYEIPYLGVSGVPLERQLPLQDLCLGLVGDRLVLRSVRLGREVVPRLTSAHNTSQGLPAYRFLAQLQEQDGGSGGWTWGALARLPFLPRVTRGRHVLARARWRFEARTLQPVLAAKGEGALAAFQVLREAVGLPRFVVLEDGDNTLWVDLDHPVRVETLLHLVAQRESFVLVEAFPGPGELVVEGPEGRFCHELVVPFEKRASAAEPRPSLPSPGKGEAIRTFLPGSEWLYLKIYTGEATADRLLAECLGPLLEANPDAWDRWFFLRYADPAPHLRLRFHGVPDVLTGVLLPRIHQALAPLQKEGLCWKVQVDTYERELERYGGAIGMPLAEAWFELDSQRALGHLQASSGDEGADQRWRLALQGMDGILAGLGLDLPGKRRLITRVREALGREFQAKGGLDIQLGERYRTLRHELEALLLPEGASLGTGLDENAASRQACLKQIKAAADQGHLTTSVEDLASSLVHMHVNRMLRSSQRAHEFVLADFLRRIYLAQEARGGGGA